MQLSLIQKATTTLRGRLLLWYLASVGLIVLLLLAAVWGLFWITLQDQIDHHVHIAVNEAKEIVEHYRNQERDQLIKNLVSARGMTVIVLSPDGAPILETNSPDVALATEHQLQKILTSYRLYQTEPVHFTESTIRFAAMPATVLAGKGIVAVGYSTNVLYDTFFKMSGIVIAILFLLILPLTIFGHRFFKKHLQPLEDIAHQAGKISNTSALSKRISISSATIELIAIQKALNTMLSRIETVVNNERDFFSDAAHTLKTPLAVLRSQIENMIGSSKIKHALLTTIDTTNDTIQDLLFLSKVGNKTQNIQEFSLTNLLENITELTATLGEDKNLKVTGDIQKKIQFKADKQLLQRALSNIAYNAVLYNRQGGTIHFSLKKKRDKIVIIISDTGLGVKKSNQLKLFTRFFRGTNTTSKGSGLGLAITKAVVEDLGGKIQLTSTVNKGTTVTITFFS